MVIPTKWTPGLSPIVESIKEMEPQDGESSQCSGETTYTIWQREPSKDSPEDSLAFPSFPRSCNGMTKNQFQTPPEQWKKLLIAFWNCQSMIARLFLFMFYKYIKTTEAGNGFIVGFECCPLVLIIIIIMSSPGAELIPTRIVDDHQQSHPAIQAVFEMAETDVKSIARSTEPLLHIFEPQLSFANMFACRNLYRQQHKYPIMQQTVDQIMTNAIESIYTKLTEVKDIMDTMLDISIEAAAESVEVTLCSARSAVDTIMDIDMAQMMASSVDKIIFKSDGLLEHFLPITDEEFFAIAFSDRSRAACPENQEGEPPYCRRLSSLSMKLCSRAYQHSRIKIKLGAEQALLQLEQLFYLLKYTKEELDYKVHRGHEKMYQMWKEWYKGEPKQDQSNGANQTEMESHSLATSYTVAQKMQEVCQNVLTNLQSLPEHLQQKVQQAQCDLTELQAVLSTATSFQDLPSGFMKETTEKINKARKALFEVMEYIAKYTCQPWVEGPYCPAEYSAEESIKHNNVY
ncbi:perilipin-3-like isoform X1 [Erythrolamprus reginae]|uniref:perilipin-3-like isoform X1 n=1 Tax=Erythrolamprus reginae TaxID=121349 RepID=UPI00396CB4C6